MNLKQYLDSAMNSAQKLIFMLNKNRCLNIETDDSQETSELRKILDFDQLQRDPTVILENQAGII